MLDLRHVQAFCVLAEELHFGRSAQRLHLAQPVLSRYIQALEASLGVLLLARTHRHVELTAAGQVFLDEARRLLQQAEQARVRARAAADGTLGRLRLGFTAMSLYTVLPALLQTFRTRFPEVALVLHELCTEEQVRALSERSVDIGVLHPPVRDGSLACIPLWEEPLLVALPANHRLAREEPLELAWLADEPFILFAQADGPVLHAAILAACGKAGFAPQIVQENNEPHVMLGLVAAGIGVSFAFAGVAQLQRPGVCLRRLREPLPAVTTAAAFLPEAGGAVVAQFLEVARSFASTT